jgi:hypothetical protein
VAVVTEAAQVAVRPVIAVVPLIAVVPRIAVVRWFDEERLRPVPPTMAAAIVIPTIRIAVAAASIMAAESIEAPGSQEALLSAAALPSEDGAPMFPTMVAAAAAEGAAKTGR